MNIEQTLFKDEGQHGIDQIVMDKDSFMILIKPFEGGISKYFEFKNFKFISFTQISKDPEDRRP